MKYVFPTFDEIDQGYNVYVLPEANDERCKL